MGIYSSLFSAVIALGVWTWIADMGGGPPDKINWRSGYTYLATLVASIVCGLIYICIFEFTKIVIWIALAWFVGIIAWGVFAGKK